MSEPAPSIMAQSWPWSSQIAVKKSNLHALSRLSKNISLKKRRILHLKSFIVFPFSYYPLIWITHSSGLNNIINHIHKRDLRIVYKEFWTSFEGLLAKDKSVSISNKNLEQLVIEIFKVKMGISPTIMKEVFSFSDNNNYNFRSDTHLIRPILRTTHYGKESITNLRAKIWELVP